MRDYFIRFGNIPKDERSGIYMDGDLVGYENGVSVYDTTVLFKKWIVIPPHPLSVDNIESLGALVLQAQSDENFPILLVTGKMIGKGTDGEPVIVDVKVIRNVREDIVK